MTKGKTREAKIFSVDTRFNKLARRPGGLPREQAIERAQANIDDIKPGFVDWLERELFELIELITPRKSGEALPADRLEQALVRCRRMRDVGATMDYSLVTFVANNLAKIIETVLSGAEYRQDMIDCHVEALQLARQEQYRRLRPDQLPDLSGGLRLVLEIADS